MRSFSLLTLVLVVGASLVYGNPTEIVLLANSIDYELAQDFITFLENKGFTVVRVEAAAFDAYTSRQFIVILGGPDAPEGIGSIVQQHLSSAEQEHLRAPGSREMYLKAYQTQSVFIIAGSDRAQTQQAHAESRLSLYGQIISQEQPPPTIPSPLPTGSITIYAGEYVGSISYWGYERTGQYTTVRLQKEYVESEERTTTRKNVTVHSGTAQSGGPNAKNITLANSSSSANDEYNDMWVEITGGTGINQIRQITDYNGTLRNATVDVDWSPVPDNTSQYRILNTISTTYVTKLRPGTFGYRVVHVTFRNTELPVRFLLEGVEYKLLYYDAEKIIIKK